MHVGDRAGCKRLGNPIIHEDPTERCVAGSCAFGKSDDVGPRIKSHRPKPFANAAKCADGFIGNE